MMWLLVLTVAVLDTSAVLLYLWSVGLVEKANIQAESYRLVAKLALAELSEARELLVALVEETGPKAKTVDKSWD